MMAARAIGSGRDLGQASSTAAADDSAMKLYNIFRVRRGRFPFNDMRFVEIESDNLEYEIKSYATFCATTPIPKYSTRV